MAKIEFINRKNSQSLKYDGMSGYFGRDDLLPFWVADMDFKSPNSLIKEIKKRAKHESFGYTFYNDEYFDSIKSWLLNRDKIVINRDDIIPIKSVVNGITIAILALTKEKDSIVTQTPTYFPFFDIIRENNRELIPNKMVFDGEKYRIDFENLKKSIKKNTKILLLCNPHNPTGRAFSKDELNIISNIAKERNLVLISDEIHSDLVYSPNIHTPFYAIDENAIVLNSPTKSFNISGIGEGYAVIKNSELREKFIGKQHALHIGSTNIFANLATISLYKHSKDYIQKLRKKLYSNIEFVEKSLKDSKISFVTPEATYLLWLDFNKVSKTHLEIKEYFLNSKIALNDGRLYGGDEKFFRMNIATSKKNLRIATDVIKNL